MAGKQEEKPRKRRKRRWGDAATTATAAPAPVPAAVNGAPATDDAKAKVLALQESVRARLAQAKASMQRPAKRAKQYELNMDVTAPSFQKEVSAATTDSASTKSKPTKSKAAKTKNSNPYLAHLDEQDEETEDGVVDQDERLASRTAKSRPRHKSLNFAEPGKWQAIAERKREKAAMIEQAGFASGRKTGHTVQSAGLGGIYGPSGVTEEDTGILPPRADAHPDTNMPLGVEWWDTDLLPSKLKKQVAAVERKALTKQTKAALQHLDAKPEANENESAATDELTELRQRCLSQAALTYSKTAALVQHIVPVKPPNASTGPPPEPVLHLTKKELKRQRKLRRQEKQRQLQDLQAAGLMEAPEPRLTLRNFIQVLGDQAFVDPSQMEQKVTEQVQARQRAHQDRNQANKLTKEQRSAKRARKLQEDTSQGVTVALFYVKDLSHPYHRAKVDWNAQQNNITGGVLESPEATLVLCEGGPKAIQRYKRLLLVRMKWTTGPDGEDDEEEDEEHDDEEYAKQKFNPDNKCELVWQGMAVKPLFTGFFFQACETSGQARKILKQKGVAHYWDQVIQHAAGNSGGLQLKLGDDSDDEDNPFAEKEEDIVMKDG